jgi:hypothetical protein
MFFELAEQISIEPKGLSVLVSHLTQIANAVASKELEFGIVYHD